MNEDARVGQRKALFGCAAGEKHGGDGGSLADAGGHYVGLYKLHGVVDGEARGDGAARRIDIELDVALGIFGLQEEHLRSGEVGDVIVDGRTDKNDVLFQQARINVVGAFAAAGLLDHHGYKRCGAVVWVVGIFHVKYGRSGPNLLHFDAAAATVRIREFCASQSRVLSLRSLAFILSRVPCFVKRARSTSADSPLCEAACSSSWLSSSSVTSMFSAEAMRSTISSAFTSSVARSCWRRRRVTQSTFTARGSTPCAARERTTRSRRTSI